jgi:hypothetical protein
MLLGRCSGLERGYLGWLSKAVQLGGPTELLYNFFCIIDLVLESMT